MKIALHETFSLILYPFASVRPCVVFNPTTPQREEGMRTEPTLPKKNY